MDQLKQAQTPAKRRMLLSGIRWDFETACHQYKKHKKRIPMELQISEEYEELSIEWQYQMILILKEKLSKFGVPEDKAKEIVGEFAFDFAMLHDQEEIEISGKSYNPRIGFFDFGENLISSDEESHLHEYAFGSTSEAYGE